MSNSLNPVFGEWYTDKQLGTGTDGKVFSIYKENYDGTRERAILKIIRLGENRNERKQFNQDGVFTGDTEDEYYEKLIKKIKTNIERDLRNTIELRDNGWTVLRFWGTEIKKNLDNCITEIFRSIETKRR